MADRRSSSQQNGFLRSSSPLDLSSRLLPSVRSFKSLEIYSSFSFRFSTGKLAEFRRKFSALGGKEREIRGCSKAEMLSLAQRCKNILASNFEAHLCTIKADAKGSESDIHSSKIIYMFKKGIPYLWMREDDLHIANTVVDERGSLSVCSSIPGPLMSLLMSIKKVPAGVELSGDLTRLGDKKVRVAMESLGKFISLEDNKVSEVSHSVSSILNSSGPYCKFKSEAYKEIVKRSENYAIYKFNIRSCSYVPGSGDDFEVDMEDVRASKTDVLAPLSGKLIDGINQNEARRRALVLFCLVYFNVKVWDALMLAIYQKGFDVLAKVPINQTKSDSQQFQWEEFRFPFEDEVPDVEAFFSLLIMMEERALKYVKSFSGIS